MSHHASWLSSAHLVSVHGDLHAAAPGGDARVAAVLFVERLQIGVQLVHPHVGLHSRTQQAAGLTVSAAAE